MAGSYEERGKLSRFTSDKFRFTFFSAFKIHGIEDTNAVVCLGDPLPLVGAQNIVELCEELACIYKSVPLICSHKQPLHVFSGIKKWGKSYLEEAELKSINAGDLSKDKKKRSKWVLPVEIINDCQLTRILDADMKKYSHIRLNDIALSVQLRQSPITSASSLALFPKFTSPPRALLVTTPQFGPIPDLPNCTMMTLRIFWGGGSWRLHESQRSWGQAVDKNMIHNRTFCT